MIRRTDVHSASASIVTGTLPSPGKRVGAVGAGLTESRAAAPMAGLTPILNVA